jgi:hypothetical protein
MRLSRSRNSRLAATSSGASVCQAAGLELERDVNDGGVRPVCPALWEPISGGFCAGLGDMPERMKSGPLRGDGGRLPHGAHSPRPPPRRTT